MGHGEGRTGPGIRGNSGAQGVGEGRGKELKILLFENHIGSRGKREFLMFELLEVQHWIGATSILGLTPVGPDFRQPRPDLHQKQLRRESYLQTHSQARRPASAKDCLEYRWPCPTTAT